MFRSTQPLSYTNTCISMEMRVMSYADRVVVGRHVKITNNSLLPSAVLFMWRSCCSTSQQLVFVLFFYLLLFYIRLFRCGQNEFVLDLGLVMLVWRGQQCEGGGVVDMRRVRVFLIVDERDRMAKNVNKAIKMWS